MGTPPVRKIERASGVSHVEVGGHTLRCFVSGSFQPLLEAVRGYEVISLRAIPAVEAIEAELPHRLTDERKDDP